MLENLPTAESIRMAQSRKKKRLKAEQKRALPGPPPVGQSGLSPFPLLEPI
jgi:hypothetical protein